MRNTERRVGLLCTWSKLRDYFLALNLLPVSVAVLIGKNCARAGSAENAPADYRNTCRIACCGNM